MNRSHPNPPPPVPTHGETPVTSDQTTRGQLAAAARASAAYRAASAFGVPAAAVDDYTGYVLDAVMAAMAGQVDALAEVLAEHRPRPVAFDNLIGLERRACHAKGCDFVLTSRDLNIIDRRFARHVAEALVVRLVGSPR